MGRAIIGVVVGYIVIFALVFATLTIAYLAMGTDRAFQPGNYEVTGLWIGVSLVLGFGAALVGGLVCAVVSRSRKAPLALAGVVVVLGVAMAVPVAMATAKEAPEPRTADVGNMDAMMKARTPVWVAFLNPLVGAAGVLLAARLKRAE